MLGHVRRNAVAYLALFVALSGTSYAAVRLPAGSVGTKQVKAGAVTGSKLHRNAVTSSRVKDRSLLAVDFALGQLPGGPAGQAGPKGDPGAQGPPGPTVGVAGLDTGCCPSDSPTAAASVTATKTVTLTTRARLYVIGSTVAGMNSCPASCSMAWGLRVDGVPVAGSLRHLDSVAGNSRETLTPFGISDALEPGTHTIALVREPITGGPPSNFFASQHIAAIALGT